jgi:hypothetical protein
MRTARPRAAFALYAAIFTLALYGCGKAGHGTSASAGGPTRVLAPVAAQGAVSVVTRNTTRVGGADAASDAAAVARTVYPGLTTESRPGAVVLVNERNWPAALAASVLASAPTSAPILYTEGNELPAVTRESLEALHPVGVSPLGGAQVLTVGTTPTLPAGLATRAIPAIGGPASVSQSMEQVLVMADGGTAPKQVIVVPSNAPRALQMPAAGLSAESGAPILFVTSARVPLVSADVMAGLNHPSIYVLDPRFVGPHTFSELRRLGHVSTIAPTGEEGTGPAAVAVAASRFTDGSFGWGIKEPGHGLVFADSQRPLDAPAAAPLSASGDYGPLLLLESPKAIPAGLASYLADIQPAYTSAPQFRPVRGVYNHGWLIGDESAISSVVQAEIDSLLEISQRKQSSSEESSTSQTE